MITRHDTTTRSDLEIIEALDFEHVPACELRGHPDGRLGHSGPAWALIRIHCEGCGRRKVRYVCQGRYVNGMAGKMRCSECGHRGEPVDFWTILAYVNAGQ